MKVRNCFTLCFFASLFFCFSAEADPRVWGPDGVPIRQGYHIEWNEATARDESGNTLLLWSDKRSGQRDVMAQLINSAGEAQWADGGVDVTPELHHQDSPVAVAVSGGWIVAWADYRHHTDCDENYGFCAEVFAQKLGYSGNRLWPENDFTGVMVETSDAGWIHKETLRLVPDGSGGAIIAWRRWNDVYARRVMVNGDLAWPDALAVTDTVYFDQAEVAAGSGGSMLVLWETFNNLYLCRVLPDGTMPWGQADRPVCIGSSFVSQMDIASDGADGCYVAWLDERGGAWNRSAYAQHLQGDGIPLWTVNGIPICLVPGDRQNISIELSSEGGNPDGLVAAWDDFRSGTPAGIYAQKVSPEGTLMWSDGGFVLAPNPDPYVGYERPIVTSDHNGGVVATWNQGDGWYGQIYGQRLTVYGQYPWGTEPIPVGNPATSQRRPIVGGDFGTYFVGYDDLDTSGVQSVRYQLLDHASGARLLGQYGMQTVSGIAYGALVRSTALLADHRSAILWTDGRLNGSVWEGPLYYQVVGYQGQIERAVNGERLVPDNTGNSWASQRGPQTCEDGTGGIFVAYEDLRDGTKIVRLSHIAPSGDNVGPDSGAVAWREAGTRDQQNPYLCPDGAGGCYVAWSGWAQNFYLDAYVMRLNANLQRVWNQPVRLNESYADDILSALVASDGCCLAAWVSGDLGNWNISGAKVCGDGSVAWSDTLCNAPGDQDNPVAVSDGNGGMYAAWVDRRAAGDVPNIYAQRVASDGTSYWTPNGIPVCAQLEWQGNQRIAVDSRGDLVVYWQDGRTVGPGTYAQKLSPSGVLRWPASGVPVGLTENSWDLNLVASENRDGVFPVWSDNRYSHNWGGDNVFATHLDSTGAVYPDPFWTPDSGGVVTERTATTLAQNPSAVSDGWGGCVVAWNRLTPEKEGQEGGGDTYSYDVYAQRIFDYATSAREQPGLLPHDFALYQNFPNPFNPVTEIRFDLPQAQRVKLAVFDLLGREVRVLVDEPLVAGNHQVNFDAASMPSGLYVYRLQAGEYTRSRKMVVLK